MSYWWLVNIAAYDFYRACRDMFGGGIGWGEPRPTDDEVATYCAGGEL